MRRTLARSGLIETHSESKASLSWKCTVHGRWTTPSHLSWTKLSFPLFLRLSSSSNLQDSSTGRIQSRALESRTAPLKESRETRTFTASTGKTSSVIQLSGSISMSTSPMVGNHAKGVRQRIASPQHRLTDSGKSEARGLVYFLFFLAFYTVIIHLWWSLTSFWH